MNKIEKKFKEIRKFCEANANPDITKKYARFFTEGYDSFGLSQEIFESQREKWLKEWKDEMTLDDYLLLGDKLISTGKYEEASYAITFMFALIENIPADKFEKFGSWLENGIVNWAHTDILSGRILAYFINNKKVGLEKPGEWTKSDSIWKKRAVPVTLVEALKVDIPLKMILKTIEPLMNDGAHKVQQGLGWLLREAWKLHPEETEVFLMKWKNTCGRTIIQYATEKMSKEYRLKFRKSKSKL